MPPKNAYLRNNDLIFLLPCTFFSITEHIDFATPLQEPAAEPLCNANLATSMHTLDHLAGVANRAAIHYTGESQLREVVWATSRRLTLVLFPFLNMSITTIIIGKQRKVEYCFSFMCLLLQLKFNSQDDDRLMSRTCSRSWKLRVSPNVLTVK